jgi:DNA-binding response OmpR family regulator
MKVLIVDDDPILLDVLSFTFRHFGYEVITAHDGQLALARWENENPDVIVLDVNLPRLDGMEICQRIREAGETPIIMLSVSNTDDDVVRGLHLGADDYITKPFSPRQLIARTEAVLRRSGASVPTRGPLTSGDLVLDVSRRLVRIGGSGPVGLTRLECRLLEYLIRNGSQVIPANALIDYVWGPAGGSRTMLRQLVRRLRRKIEPDADQPVYVETVPGIGYALGDGRAAW